MKLFTPRLFLLFVMPNLFISLVMLTVSNGHLLSVLNVLNLVLAVWVVVAFFPVVIGVLLTTRTLDRADIFGLGIFMAWSSTIILRTYSVAWRWLDYPVWLTDSDILNYGLFVQTCAAILHLAAPNTVGDRIPPARWIRVGAVAACVVLFALMMGYFYDAHAFELD